MPNVRSIKVYSAAIVFSLLSFAVPVRAKRNANTSERNVHQIRTRTNARALAVGLETRLCTDYKAGFSQSDIRILPLNSRISGFRKIESSGVLLRTARN